ncbi:MAG: glycogen synthase GlgA [Deltaproteobacteria bacterium]|nr:glycogen synthase GlgA [Deltaproteobacteria bacterium]
MKNNKLNILVAASEASPLAQAGGLGDVIGSLPLVFSDMGHRVAVTIPAYRRIMEKNPHLKIVAKELPIPLGKINVTADILAEELAPNVPAYLVRRDEFFDRSELYGSSQGEYMDNCERYIFFSRSIPALCEAIDFLPDVILANDWQTGLVMALLNEGSLPHTAGVFAIHNLGYMGLVPQERIEIIGLPDSYYTMEGLEYFGQMSLLKAGIVYAQEVVTVSPTYAKEIQEPAYGHGLAGLMYSVRDRLNGILNGVNYEIWSPATDHNIAATFSPKSLSGKIHCKKALLKEMGLPNNLLEKPLVAIVTRLFDQKGCRLVAEAADELFALDLGLILLADGDISYQRLFAKIQNHYPSKFSLRFGFDAVLSHKIIAGSDMFLMPSLYEPCGLTQMYSLKYGTIPIVRATGGLQDTVIDPDENNSKATGFKFNRFHKDHMIASVRKAIEAFRKPKLWQSMMLNAMSQDFSWEHSAKEYIKVFDRALASKRQHA